MKEREVEQKGYRFTGDYSRSKAETKERADEYKRQGYKVVVCDVPDSKLSRGGGGVGYSIHAEPKYFIDKEIEEINRDLSRVDNRKQYALDKYNKEIIEIENDKTRLEERLKELTK